MSFILSLSSMLRPLHGRVGLTLRPRARHRPLLSSVVSLLVEAGAGVVRAGLSGALALHQHGFRTFLSSHRGLCQRRAFAVQPSLHEVEDGWCLFA